MRAYHEADSGVFFFPVTGLVGQAAFGESFMQSALSVLIFYSKYIIFRVVV